MPAEHWLPAIPDLREATSTPEKRPASLYAAPAKIKLAPLRAVCSQPCLCLWRGSEQMTLTTPLRLMTLHLRQTRFT